jgi:hypothetical protein
MPLTTTTTTTSQGTAGPLTIPIVAADGTQSTVTLAAPVVTTPAPLGVTGAWTIYLDEEFTGSALNSTIWNPWWYEGIDVNSVQTSTTNVSVVNGLLTMTLSDSSHGAAICSMPKNPSNAGFAIGAECFWEARINYPGNGTSLYNWNAFWLLRGSSDTADPTIEIDIAETDGWTTPPNASGAHMNFNYIRGYPDATQTQYFYGYGAQGKYLGGWHTYGLHRTLTALTLYVDGVAMDTIPTVAIDTGLPQYCIINAGLGGTEQVPSSFQVDYVRAWAPTGTIPNLSY